MINFVQRKRWFHLFIKMVKMSFGTCMIENKLTHKWKNDQGKFLYMLISVVNNPWISCSYQSPINISSSMATHFGIGHMLYHKSNSRSVVMVWHGPEISCQENPQNSGYIYTDKCVAKFIYGNHRYQYNHYMGYRFDIHFRWRCHHPRQLISALDICYTTNEIQDRSLWFDMTPRYPAMKISYPQMKMANPNGRLIWTRYIANEKNTKIPGLFLCFFFVLLWTFVFKRR